MQKRALPSAGVLYSPAAEKGDSRKLKLLRHGTRASLKDARCLVQRVISAISISSGRGLLSRGAYPKCQT